MSDFDWSADFTPEEEAEKPPPAEGFDWNADFEAAPAEAGGNSMADNAKRAANWYARGVSAPLGPLATLLPEPFDVDPLKGGSELESAAKGFEQGSSLGFEDENTGVRAGARAALSGENPLDAYRSARDADRRSVDASRAANPKSFLGGDVVGSLAVPVPLKGGKFWDKLATAATAGAGIGAAQSLGHGQADLTKGEAGLAAFETLVGAGAGAAGGALGQGVSSLGGTISQKVADFARKRVGAADTKLDELATAKVAKDLLSAGGDLGAPVQQGNRLVENIMRMEQAGALNAAQKAALVELRRTGQWDDLVKRLADSNLEELPGKAAEIEGRRAALLQAQAGQDEAFDLARRELADPLAQVMPRLKRYAAPLAGMLGGSALGAGIGFATGGGTEAAIGGLAGAGARPAMQAMSRMVSHPSIQRTAYGAVQRLLQTNPQALGRFAKPLAVAMERGEQEFAVRHFVLAQQEPEYREMTKDLERLAAADERD